MRILTCLGGYLLLILATLAGCRNELPDLPKYQTTPYNLEEPKGFPPMPQPAFNPMTEEGVLLGRYLYYDTILSTTGRSCSSCHHASRSFSAPMGPHNLSVPPHLNLGWNPDFGWNGAEKVLDHVAIIDLEVPHFIAPDMEVLKERLANSSFYRDKFQRAFGVDIVSLPVEERKLYISYALGQFIRSMVGADSKFDKYMNNEGVFLTDSEIRGYQIFFSERGDCFHCHGGPLFSDNEFHNNGLDASYNDENAGRYMVTGNPADMGKWSSPTLRNIELTAPYMHDGRFQTLEEVVEFYNSQVQHSATLDPIMTKPGKETGLNLTIQEKQDLVNFLKTLTDTTFTNNPKYSNPLK